MLAKHLLPFQFSSQNISLINILVSSQVHHILPKAIAECANAAVAK